MAISDTRGQIALSMIVRDEEDVLGRCLASARDWVGEIVVVDTGSSDRSVAIAESFGARVIPFTWCDDFSAPRNASLEAASLPWALVLDADEELVVEDASAFERAVTTIGPAGFSLTLNNQLEQGLSGDFHVFRFFRRDMEGMRYRGQLHEQIVAVAEKRVATAHLHGMRILHHGHTAQRVAQKQKGARNVRLARALVAARPEDPFAWFSLAREQGPDRMSSYRRALDLLGASGQCESRDDWVLHLYVDYCTALKREGEDREAEHTADQGLVLFPRSPDLRFARGQARLARGDAAGAAEDFVCCLSTDSHVFPLVANSAVIGHAARAQLAVALAHLGRRGEAIAHLERAAEEAPPGDPTALRLLGMMRLLDGRAASAVEAFQRAIDQAPSEGALRLALGRALLAASDFGPAFVALAHPCAPSEARTLLHRTILDLLARVPADARAALSAWQKLAPCSADACYWLGHAALEEHDVSGAAGWWRQAVEREPSHGLALEGLRLLAASSVPSL